MRLLNDLEVELAMAQHDSDAIDLVGNALFRSMVIIPAVRVEGEGVPIFKPILMRGKYGLVVACFSDSSRVGKFARMGPLTVRLRGSGLLRGVREGHGIVVNPGTALRFEFSSEDIQRMVKEPLRMEEPIQRVGAGPKGRPTVECALLTGYDGK